MKWVITHALSYWSVIMPKPQQKPPCAILLTGNVKTFLFLLFFYANDIATSSCRSVKDII